MNIRKRITVDSLARSQCGFSLIELLVVLAVVGILFGVAMAIPLGEEREGQVRGAAEELAAVLRETRSRAMKKNTPYAVVFNIENAPGSSGKVLNNRSGGHWYRVIGPRDSLLGQNGDAVQDNTFHTLPFINMQRSALNGTKNWAKPPVLRHYLNLVGRSWIDEPHHLAKGKVRFLALTDQDNGDNAAPAGGGYYTATYPRPWFGWWDSNTKELHTWGGYEPDLKGENQYFPTWNRKSIAQTIVNGRTASISGFYYEGWEGEIIGCVNPADRLVLDDDESNLSSSQTVGIYDSVDIATGNLYTVSRKDEPRPLINGNWLDYAIVFRPDGTVEDDWFRLRQAYWQVYWDSYGNRPPNQAPCSVTYPPPHDLKNAGLTDRCNGCAFMRNWNDYTVSEMRNSPCQREATSYVDRTGFYWITLAADAKTDVSTFPSAEAALHSMNPIYRVGISPDGQVKVIRVSSTYDGTNTFDGTITGSSWEDKNKIWGKTGATWSPNTPVTQPNYINHRLNNADGTPRGLPVYDVVLPEMLRDRKWWWKFP